MLENRSLLSTRGSLTQFGVGRRKLLGSCQDYKGSSLLAKGLRHVTAEEALCSQSVICRLPAGYNRRFLFKCVLLRNGARGGGWLCGGMLPSLIRWLFWIRRAQFTCVASRGR